MAASPADWTEAAAAITGAIQATATSTADWITAWATVAAAVGTVGALLAALKQIRNERLARRALELRTGQLARRAQAAGVSAWVDTGIGEHEVPVVLSNTSEQPVYRAAACVVFIQGAAPRTGKEMAEVGLLERTWQRTASFRRGDTTASCPAATVGWVALRVSK
jgi:hypothetical protein